TPPEYAPEVKPLPAKENGTITFGCFNNPTKVNNDILDQWAVIMGRVPESRLFLKSKQYDTEALRKRIIEKMESCGIAKDRLLFEGHTRHTELLASYNQVDIALDPWPYSGGLTTCEALWMGVPVITIPGPTFAGRHSTTHLANAGYPEWIAETWEEYIEKAVSLATDTDRLAKIRADMREQVANSPVCDGKRFGAHLSIALREMWKQRVNGYEKNLPEGEWQDHIEVKALSEQEIEATAHAPGPVAEDDNLIFDPSFLDDENLNGEHIEIAEPKKEVHSDKQPEGNPQKSPPANGVSPNGAAKPAAYSQNGKNGSGPGLPDTFKIKTKDHVTICTPGDLKLLTPYVLLEQEEWFEPELAFVRDYLKSGMTVLDVGAGFGAYALPIAKQVGDQGKVFAFEPGPVARQHLEMSKLENKFTNLEVIGKAVSDASAKVNYLIAETPELNKLDENGGEEISATTIDAWWEFEGRPGVDFIKLDVNGFEFKALSGAESLLSEASPVILFAMGEGGSQVTKTIKQLNEKGYRLYEYVPGPGLLTPYDAQTGGDSYMMNLIALKESHTELFIGSGLLHNEDFEPEEPEAGLWKQILRVQPWSRDKIDEWEQQELSPQNKDYLRALDYLCAAEQVNVNTSP
ncbi:MAG: FkbM family methyltransferase, partial [Balneolales bacterium]